MAQYKKQILFLFGVLVLIGALSVYSFPKEELLPVTANLADVDVIQVYVLDEDEYVIPVSIELEKGQSVEDKANIVLGYLCGKQTIKGFSSFFQEDCNVINLALEHGQLNVAFDEGFASYQPQQELRLLEAIAWGMTQFEEVQSVSLTYLDQVLTQMPLEKTPIPQSLNASIGINQFETMTNRLHDSNSMTVFYSKQIKEQRYMVPKSRRMQNKGTTLDEKVMLLMKDFASTNLQHLPAVQQVEVLNTTYDSGKLSVTVSDEIYASDQSVKEDVYQSLLLTFQQLEGVKSVEIQTSREVLKFQDKSEIRKEELRYNVLT